VRVEARWLISAVDNFPVSNFAQTPTINGRNLPGSNHHFKVTPPRNTLGRMEAVMYNAQRCRAIAVDCLLADPCESSDRELNLSVAALWLSLAREDKMTDNLLANWEAAESVVTGGLAA
jgi:hypothetical protein